MIYLLPIPAALIIMCLLIAFGILNIDIFGLAIWEWIFVIIFIAIVGAVAKFLTVIEGLLALVLKIPVDLNPDGSFAYYLMCVVNFVVLSYLIIKYFG